MDYGDLAVFEQLTGRAYFTPDGQVGQINLGNIVSHKLEFNPKRKPKVKSRRGQLFTEEITLGFEPRFTIVCDEFSSPLLPLIFLGEALPDLVQTAATGASFAFSATRGLAFAVGAYGISSVAMTVPSGKVAGADYIVGGRLGQIYIPLASSIANGTACTVTFNRVAIGYDSIDALTEPSTIGTLTVFEEDDFSDLPKTIYTCRASLTVDGAGETKVDDFKKITLLAHVIGGLRALKRQAGAVPVVPPGFDELLLDDDTIIDFS